MKTKRKKLKVWPFASKFDAVASIGIIYIKKSWWDKSDKWVREELIDHEETHIADGERIGWLKYAFLYAGEFLENLPKYGWRWYQAYYNITFERKARGEE